MCLKPIMFLGYLIQGPALSVSLNDVQTRKLCIYLNLLASVGRKMRMKQVAFKWEEHVKTTLGMAYNKMNFLGYIRKIDFYLSVSLFV